MEETPRKVAVMDIDSEEDIQMYVDDSEDDENRKDDSEEITLDEFIACFSWMLLDMEEVDMNQDEFQFNGISQGLKSLNIPYIRLDINDEFKKRFSMYKLSNLMHSTHNHESLYSKQPMAPPDSMENAFHRYLDDLSVKDSEDIECPLCLSNDIQVETGVQHASDALLVHFNRFSYVDEMSPREQLKRQNAYERELETAVFPRLVTKPYRDKMRDACFFSVEQLDFSKFFIHDDANDNFYYLAGAILHSGKDPNLGIFTSLTRTTNSNGSHFYLYDGNYVMQKGKHCVWDVGVYMLLYLKMPSNLSPPFSPTYFDKRYLCGVAPSKDSNVVSDAIHPYTGLCIHDPNDAENHVSIRISTPTSYLYDILISPFATITELRDRACAADLMPISSSAKLSLDNRGDYKIPEFSTEGDPFLVSTLARHTSIYLVY